MKKKKTLQTAIVNDVLSDTLTRLRNAANRRLKSTHVIRSKFAASVLRVLQAEGYINGVEDIADQPYLSRVHLKYVDEKPAIVEMRRVSTPGRRVYVGIEGIPAVRNGLGVAVLSTSQGVLSDGEALKKRVGGELLCTIF